MLMIAPKRKKDVFPLDRPTPMVWSEFSRDGKETALDSETAITLACHLGWLFDTAKSWDALVVALDDRDFFLRFEDTRLVLCNAVTGTSLCTCASMGNSYASLKTRLGKARVMASTGRIIALPRSV